MITTSIVEMAAQIRSRAERGRDLYLRRRALIVHEGGDTYRVPSCSGSGTYTVHYGGETESCTCTDFGVHQGRLACKHLTAVALMHAARRRVHSTCPVCGVSSRERTLVGRRGDRRRDGQRWCLPHHPGSIAATLVVPVTAAGDPLIAAASR